MRILAFILLCGVMFGLSGCGAMMIGNNGPYEKGVTKMPKEGDGGMIDEDASKYYRGEIKIITKPAGLEVELYNRGELLKSKEDLGFFETPAKRANRILALKMAASRDCYKEFQQGAGFAQCDKARKEAKEALASGSALYEDSEKVTVMRDNGDGMVSFVETDETMGERKERLFIQGLDNNVTPATARLIARTPENDASNYVLVFKKNGKEIARKEIKTHINWWVYIDPILIPFGPFLFLGEMGWMNDEPYYYQTRSYLTQGDIEIDLTEEIKKLGL
ncbi:hypothetical protein Hc94105_1747 [Helicobacter cinaedi]|uniref:hypothetical protein n=1 Tax=Helicobacter cinaedi TaxID=213 RepID=UPI001F1D7AAB|nr:hypothetical protein [Helicobacter cinaedi]BDB67524.1 hypothetical protein Hc94105_1747 [Helicobacter cinaedi]